MMDNMEPFDLLESKVKDVVERYVRIRDEKQHFEKVLKEKDLMLNALEFKYKNLRKEKEVVKRRVDALLKKIESITSLF